MCVCAALKQFTCTQSALDLNARTQPALNSPHSICTTQSAPNPQPIRIQSVSLNLHSICTQSAPSICTTQFHHSISPLNLHQLRQERRKRRDSEETAEKGPYISGPIAAAPSMRRQNSSTTINNNNNNNNNNSNSRVRGVISHQQLPSHHAGGRDTASTTPASE